MKTIDDVMLFWALIVAILALGLLYLFLTQYARRVSRFMSFIDHDEDHHYR